MKTTSRKIIHVDMDCFYAAVEVRDNPDLANKPVAVGGYSAQRGVLCTCNYAARSYGVHSAMATAKAYQLCPELIVLPVNMAKYKAVSTRIQTIFREFTDLVEPLSLDEAYLDVTDSSHCQGSATLIAQAIRKKIWQEENLIASAGVAPNKFLAKIASGWKKPNGLYVIEPKAVTAFIEVLPVEKLYGVGRVTAKKLHQLGFKTCADLQKYSHIELVKRFGKLGQNLYEQSRGIDERSVDPHRIRKSISVENTFEIDLTTTRQYQKAILTLYEKLVQRTKALREPLPIKNQFIKIKFNDFTATTAEIKSTECAMEYYQRLFSTAFQKQNKPIRLLGLGLSFIEPSQPASFQQQELF